MCKQHRVLSGKVGYDKEGKALGGVNCQCSDAVECTVNQKRVMHYLEVPDDIVLHQPKVKGCKSKGKSKGKDEAGKGKSKRWLSSSSSSVWRPR